MEPAGIVFISYSHRDQKFVHPLARNLQERGLQVWVDQWDIPAGVDWDQTIEQAIYDCSALLLVLSPNAVSSQEVRGEWRLALDEGKPIIPVLYQTCRIPRQLRLVQHIDFSTRDPDDPEGLKALIETLGTLTPAGEPAVRPTVDCRPAQPSAGQTVHLSASAEGAPPIRFSWDLGDGQTAEGDSIRHAYRQAGSYAVTLTASNEHGQDSVQRILTVAEPVRPVAQPTVEWRPAQPKAGQTVHLSASAEGAPPIQFSWDLGDGQTAEGDSIHHAYRQAGSYAVTLTASNEHGRESVQQTLTVTEKKPAAWLQALQRWPRWAWTVGSLLLLAVLVAAAWGLPRLGTGGGIPTSTTTPRPTAPSAPPVQPTTPPTQATATAKSTEPTASPSPRPSHTPTTLATTAAVSQTATTPSPTVAPAPTTARPTSPPQATTAATAAPTVIPTAQPTSTRPPTSTPRPTAVPPTVPTDTPIPPTVPTDTPIPPTVPTDTPRPTPSNTVPPAPTATNTLPAG